MSEYQNFEWKAVERALSATQRREVSELSSHIRVHGDYAQVDYRWGNFKHDPIRVLERYFDVFAYEAKWGQQRIAMRFPRDAFNLEAVSAFEVDDVIRLSVKGGNLLIEAGFIENWVSPCCDPYGDEGDGGASPVIEALEVIYGEMLAGDLRGLFLLWLEACRQVDADNDPCVPVPPGLGDLAWQHERLIEFIEVDRHDLAAAQARSGKMEKGGVPKGELADAVEKLMPGRKDHYLKRLVDGDAAHVRAELRRELRKVAGAKARHAAGGEPVAYGQLSREAEELRRQEKRKLAEEKERKRLEYLGELDRREDEIWDRVGTLVAEKKPKAYDEAVVLLRGLKDLWSSRENLESFRQEVRMVLESFPRLVGFHDRVRRAGLLDAAKVAEQDGTPLNPQRRTDDPQQCLRVIRLQPYLEGARSVSRGKYRRR